MFLLVLLAQTPKGHSNTVILLWLKCLWSSIDLQNLLMENGVLRLMEFHILHLQHLRSLLSNSIFWAFTSSISQIDWWTDPQKLIHLSLTAHTKVSLKSYSKITILLFRATIWMATHSLLLGKILIWCRSLPVVSYILNTRSTYLTLSRSKRSMDFGVWTENSRAIYNKWDGVARSTTQVSFL